ncbi:Serine/threonine protein kinase, SvkA [Chondrus crispus]|uniref:non-specific serine/threonine protein kinase n=1 Tax=Chondrus crispus TaxID=2769 RepID=R7Q418_CHOCR|nr:Serine/threonine protein kinase, SvkA [Chondrus crispus]CDF32764.1 Serine/threonine protein kinase, SvkA [Chondrus crispus]|eukprot:XP_005712565.1 Serine/threonine protein kinase, SvkA [Chondrus crispus]
MPEHYEKNECIGKGSFGEVFKGKEIATGRKVALKLVDLEKADEEIDVIQREIKVMSQISNPYVVQYYSSLMKGSTLWIAMEYMAAGSLKELLDVVGPFPEESIATVLKALFKGLDYVHKGHKLHRDIKAANILLSENGDVKLADFGVAGQMTGTVRQRNTFVGSPFWMAPEVIQESLYDEKADIWSAGITGMELANGIPPYATEHPYRALFLIPKSEPPRLDGHQFSRSCKDFISLCLKKNPVERPSADQLLGHPFLRKARTSSIKELLKKKHQATSVEQTEKVILGGNSIGSSNGTFRRRGSGANSSVDAQENPRLWEFDFGSLNDSQTDGKDSEKAPQETSGNSETKQTEGNVEQVTPIPGSSDENGEQDESRKPREYVNTNGEVPAQPPIAPENEVLSQLILPVISQIRADVGTTGLYNQSLMASLGALEVAFVDAESARPGVSTALFESLLVEGLKSPSPKIRALLLKCFQANGTKKV